MSPQPLVSVIICVYNAGRYFEAALQSILRQSYRAIEIIIVDDGSTDGCIEAADAAIRSDDRIHLIRQANQGKPAALNVALGSMRGDYYLMHDADDISDPRRVEVQLDCLQRNPEVAAVFCGYDVILDDVRMAPILQAKGVEECREDIRAFRMPSHDPTGMYRWSMVRDLRYDTALPIGEGLDYILRVGERYPMMVVDECLYSYRIHMNSITKRDPGLRDRMADLVMRRARERRGVADDAKGGSRTALRGNRARDNNLAAHFIDSVCSLKQHGRMTGALRAGLQCARLHPGDPHYWKAFVYATMPVPLMQRIRTRHAVAVR